MSLFKDRFIIFSKTRCGSTTLMRALNLHPDIFCIFEPFNKWFPGNKWFPSNLAKDYLGRVHDPASLDAALEDIWKTCNAFKHIWHPGGWPFAPNSDFNERLMVKRGQQILFLNRRNDLQRLVSNEISIQSSVWAIVDETYRERLLRTRFKPLDIAKIQLRLIQGKRAFARQKQLLLHSGLDFMELWYEDLYACPSTREQRKDEFNRILAFLGRSAITDDETVIRVNDLFDCGQNKQSSEAIYRMIPGIGEVEQECGSEQTGWLFKKIELATHA